MSELNSSQNSQQVKKQSGQMGSWARYYDLIMTLMTFGREDKLRQTTVKLARLEPGDRVLEIGCSTGTLSLASKGQVGPSGEVFGIDIAPEMIAVARRKATRKGVDVNFQVGSIAGIPFPDNRFDTVLCSFMIFHMPEDIRLQGFKEIYRVLKSEGHLFIVDSASKDKRYDVRELAPVLKANSYTDIESGGMRFALFKGWFLRVKASKQ
ncbi:MAG TPA: methyltransferase domain-containing protein [Dehalococcoidales bacterium]|nr:methyltransferase domain-containing protein [Dehalococcoidales bacterium]